jgi:predicted ATPase
LLDLLVDRVHTLRVLVIITFRPEFTPPWIGRPHVTVLNLNRLARQRAEMIVHESGGKGLPKQIADQIIDRTDGVHGHRWQSHDPAGRPLSNPTAANPRSSTDA